MRPIFRGMTLGLLSFTLVGLMVTLFTTSGRFSSASASSPDVGAPVVNAVTNFQGCWATSKTPTDVLVLMDTTASLRSTDPLALRVVGLEAALRAMALANVANPKVEFRVRIVGFSQSIEYFSGPGLSSWTPVTNQTLSSLDASANTFRSQNDGDFTNFASALAGSEALLGPRGANCKALLWFTDGANDESNNGQVVPTQPVEHQNTEKICQAGGIADAFVRDRIFSFAVGLTNQTGSEGQRELQTIVEGHSTAGPDPDFTKRCGQNGVSDTVSLQTGTFFDSPTAQQLIIGMQKIFSPIDASGAGPGPGGECLTNQRCPASNASTFWVGPGVKDFFIDTDSLGPSRAQSRSGTPQIVLTDVGSGNSIRLERTTRGTICYSPQPTSKCSIDGVRVLPSSITNGELAVTGQIPSDLPASGSILRLNILTPSEIDSTQYLFYETPSVQMKLAPVAQSGSQSCPSSGSGSFAYVECPAHFSVELVNSSNGRIFPLGSLGNLSATIPETSVATTVSTRAHGTPIVSFTMPSGSSPGPLLIQLHSVLHLGPKGFWLLSLGDTSTFDLRTQPGYPSVVIPSQVSTLSPGQSKVTEVVVRPGQGGETNGGCFGIKAISVTNVAGLRANVAVARKWKINCVPLSKTHSVQFALSTKLVDASAGGPFDVNLSAILGSASTSGSLIDVNYQLRLRAFLPLNVGRSVILFVLLLVGGVVLLLAVALGVNLLTGRFAPLNVIMLHGYDVKLAIEASTFLEPDNQTKEKDFGELTSRYDVEEDKEWTKRTFAADGLSFRAVLGQSLGAKLRGLINGATGTVQSDADAPIIVGTEESVTALRSGPHPISLSLDGTWIFRPTNVDLLADNDFFDSSESTVQSVTGHLTFIIREGADSQYFRQLRRSAFRKLSSGIDEFGQSASSSGSAGSATGQAGAAASTQGDSWSDDL